MLYLIANIAMEDVEYTCLNELSCHGGFYKHLLDDCMRFITVCIWKRKPQSHKFLNGKITHNNTGDKITVVGT